MKIEARIKPRKNRASSTYRLEDFDLSISDDDDDGRKDLRELTKTVDEREYLSDHWKLVVQCKRRRDRAHA